ncbi:c-type cytochrome biogenesis protein CcsB [Rarobacter faecitabidus]|uniref:Cytochrome c-type biogenesis protein CcsB n=1 Tax=Rarobacter faecitabidus TaxID=13243 RepID=A0A542ZTV0_RARFA|nr:c-type cytochrome biogenesis protein CcsB [Rarobacter faecitabidus]TQL63784.1 cytochrome c-type biogenesis protein CcsB [Rarobacter faecitabidus]
MTIAEVSDVLVWGTATAYLIAMILFTVNLVSGRGALADSTTEAQVKTSDRRRAKSLGMARSVVQLGVLLQLAAIITRGIAAGRAPWANMYEFTLVGSFVAIVAFLIVAYWKGVWFIGAPVTGIATAFLGVGLTQWHVVADGVQPALQSYWLILHVGIAVSGAGIFTVGMVLTVLQLLRDSYDRAFEAASAGQAPREAEVIAAGSAAAGSTWDDKPSRLVTVQIEDEAPAVPANAGILRWRWLSALPSPSTLEVTSFRVNSIAFVLWTFVLITGAVWAEDAWGRYWQWDPKEVWSFVVWVVYAAYLHARATNRWTGRRAAYLVIAGYACLIFNFTGVNLLFNGKHSYSGL